MATEKRLTFFLVRYVPAPVKEEFVNVGVVLLESGKAGRPRRVSRRYASVHFTRDWARVCRLDPSADLKMLKALKVDLRSRL